VKRREAVRASGSGSRGIDANQFADPVHITEGGCFEDIQPTDTVPKSVDHGVVATVPCQHQDRDALVVPDRRRSRILCQESFHPIRVASFHCVDDRRFAGHLHAPSFHDR